MKKNMIIISILFISGLAASVSAILYSMDNKSNIFSAGTNVSRISEKFDAFGELNSGEEREKNVCVLNEGSVPCFVRIFAEIENPEIREHITIDYDTTNWTEKQQDGYYYYRNILQPGEKTTPLFTTLNTDRYLKTLNLICYSETVQADDAKTAAEAFGMQN